jgi:hypothetical protein
VIAAVTLSRKCNWSLLGFKEFQADRYRLLHRKMERITCTGRVWFDRFNQVRRPLAAVKVTRGRFYSKTSTLALYRLTTLRRLVMPSDWILRLRRGPFLTNLIDCRLSLRFSTRTRRLVCSWWLCQLGLCLLGPSQTAPSCWQVSSWRRDFVSVCLCVQNWLHLYNLSRHRATLSKAINIKQADPICLIPFMILNYINFGT